jgi:effector-binding domain-containing protein
LALVDALAGADALPVPDVDVAVLEPVATAALAGPATADSLAADARALVARLLATASAQGVPTDPPVVGEYPVALDGTWRIRMHLPVEGEGPGAALAGDGGLAAGSVFGGRYARAVHVGPYETLPLAYHGLLRWMHDAGHAAHGPVLERYVDDPDVTDPAHLRTEVLHALP